MKKYVNDSYAQQVHVLTMSNINGYHRLFGGQLMCWIDEVAAVVARRHCGKNVTTASVDKLEFKKAAYANDTVVIKGRITHAGNTSMEVNVKTYVESLDGRRVLINNAYIVMIALDENERPTQVPKLILKNDEEKLEWENALKRKESRKSDN